MPTEEDIAERERKAEARHKALLDAINGKMVTGKKVTASKVEDEEEGSIFDNILGTFGLKDIAKSALSGLGRMATFAVGPIGAPLLAAAAIGAFGYFIYKSLKAEPSYEAEQEAKGIRQAESVGGLAGVKNEEDRIRKLPEYERTMAELKSAEKTYWKDEDGNPQFGTDKQLEGYARRGPESAKAVQDYKKERDTQLKVIGEEPKEVPTPMVSESSGTAVPVSATPPSAAVNSAIAENLEMNLPMASTPVGETINTTNINAQNQPSQSVTEIPLVRNMEETFQRMILYSTRVV